MSPCRRAMDFPRNHNNNNNSSGSANTDPGHTGNINNANINANTNHPTGFDNAHSSSSLADQTFFRRLHQANTGGGTNASGMMANMTSTSLHPGSANNNTGVGMGGGMGIHNASMMGFGMVGNISMNTANTNMNMNNMSGGNHNSNFNNNAAAMMNLSHSGFSGNLGNNNIYTGGGGGGGNAMERMDRLSMLQAATEREEEALMMQLQMLQARRQGWVGQGGPLPIDDQQQQLRQQQQQQHQHVFSQNMPMAGGNNPNTMSSGSSSYANELHRFRQAGNASAGTAAMFEENIGSPSNMSGMGMRGYNDDNNYNYNESFLSSIQLSQRSGSGGMSHHMMPPSNLSILSSAGMGGLNMNVNVNIPAGSGVAGGSSGGGTPLDNYLIRTQQQDTTSNMMMGMSALSSGAQERIELSPQRYLAMQQQHLQQRDGRPNFMDFSGQRGAMGGFGMGPMAGGGDMKFSSPDWDKLDKLPFPDDDSGSVKRKRKHKKKPADMPRRPLSAYNLFFSEERERILQEIEDKEKAEAGGGGDDEKTDEIGDKEKGNDNSDDKGESEGETKKPRALLRPLLSSEMKRRPHRKTHGKIGFRDLAQMVGQRWKALPDEKRQYFQDLAKMDMVRQKAAMEAYYEKQAEKMREGDAEVVKEDDVNTDNQVDEDESATKKKKTAPKQLAA